MTTFHQLLGTKPNDSIERVKQRYRLLSQRVHPDKGGTDVLMLLVSHAFENIKAGKGERKLTIPSAENISESQALAQLKQENLWLKKQLRQAEADKAYFTKSGKVEQTYIKNVILERAIKQLEKQLTLLKNERRHLLHRKETEQAEKLRLAKELKRLLKKHHLLEGKQKNSHRKMLFQFWTANLALFTALLCLSWLVMSTLKT